MRLLRTLYDAVRISLEWLWFTILVPSTKAIYRFLLLLREKAPGFFYSFWLHITLFILLVGVPLSCPKKMPEQSVITVDLLPVGEITNVKPKPPQPKQESKQSSKKPTGFKPKPEEKPKVKPKPKVKIPKKAVPQAKPKPKPKPKPKEEPKEEPKPAPEPEEDAFDKVLKSVEQLKSKAKQQTPDQDYDASLPLMLSAIDAIKRQIAKCWSIPAGARDAMDMQVPLYIKLLQDGSVIEVAILEKARYASDTFYRAAADAAVRAVRTCSPLKGLPPDKYSLWREIEMTFDPRDMLY